MRLEQIEAIPHPAGNRIDLSWSRPEPAAFPHLRLVRREGSHPVTPEPASPRQGVVVADTQPAAEQGLIEADAEGVFHAVDQGLKGEVVYYYSIYPYRDGPLEFDVDRRNRGAALATAANDFGGRMYRLLPAIYHRYDTVLPRAGSAALAAADLDRGQLRRFLDLPGGELDRLYSFTRALLDACDLEQVDGRLLPLLAQWIGWKTDFRLELDAQRREIANAPALYQRIGILPVVAATVERISGWQSRPKEFIHNVCTTNRPERLNLWLARRDAGGSWSLPQDPLSLNYAYQGRPAAARDPAGALHLFFHTPRRRGWAIWTKTLPAGGEWTESRPVVDRGDVDRQPAAALQGATLWLFWETYDRATGSWRIPLRTLTGGEWSAIGPPAGASPFGSEQAQRRSPAAAVDPDGGLWLCWRQLDSQRWQLRYNRHDGVGWQLDPPASLPLDGGVDPGVEDDVVAFAHPTDPVQRLWLFWSRRRATADPAQTRWSTFYRVKGGLDPADSSDWSEVRELAKADADHQDREPAVRVSGAGELEVFLASDRDGGWSIWRNTLGIAGVVDVGDLSAHTWDPGSAESIIAPPYSQRAPLAVEEGGEVLLIHRSNRSLTYTNQVYGSLETRDARYAGSTTVGARDAAKIALHGELEDFQTYTFHAAATGRYAPGALGVYLTPGTADPGTIAEVEARLERVLGEFMPATSRALLITPSA